MVDHAFDIIFALDEFITYGGMNESIPLQQVRVNLVRILTVILTSRPWKVMRRNCLPWCRRAR